MSLVGYPTLSPPSLAPALDMRLPHLLVNVREDGHHKPADQVREFILCFQDIPLSLPVHQVLRMIEVQLLGALREQSKRKMDPQSAQLVLANAGMTMVDNMRGDFHVMQAEPAGRRRGPSRASEPQAQFLTPEERSTQEEAERERAALRAQVRSRVRMLRSTGERVDSDEELDKAERERGWTLPSGWRAEQPSLVDFLPPYFNREGKPELFNLVSGDAHRFWEVLGCPDKLLNPTSVANGQILYGLVEAKAKLCEELWRIYQGKPRKGADLKAEARTVFDHPQAAQGWGQTSGRVANPVHDVVVRAQVMGAPEEIRAKAQAVLEELDQLVQRVHGDCATTPEAGPEEEELRAALYTALKDQKAQLLLEWHPDKGRTGKSPQEAKSMTQLLIPLFQRIFKVLGREEVRNGILPN
ncbi:psmD8-1 [Symbiodinium natans]|uniref:PsmD8-1 protein n=1 Tax=Symbiodinium natans TaxID=878477 RepID=A0A812QQH3_9DINO|nr:psmD8-1 [Symbiodinium natans]